MADKKIDNRLLSLEDLLKIPLEETEEIKRTLLHEIRMLYAPIEAAVEVVTDLDADRVQDREMLFDMMKRAAEKIDKYIDHIQSYIKTRAEMKRADVEGKETS